MIFNEETQLYRVRTAPTSNRSVAANVSAKCTGVSHSDKFIFMSRINQMVILLNLLLSFILSAAAAGSSYRYIRIGAKKDMATKLTPGIAMMGGGVDLDEAFRWLCAKANGGDFLILRARGDDDYNSYVNGLCQLNSVATLIIPDRTSAREPIVAEIIRRATAIFIAGGDQARYVNFWMGTPVEDALNADIAQGVAIGGTSAGLAVLGEFAYGALRDKPDDKDLTSTEVLLDPFSERITLVRDFLRIPRLDKTLTDSHFAKRDRMGRSLGFLARIIRGGWSKDPREIAIDEKSAVLVEDGGRAKVVGPGNGAYFIRPGKPPQVCERGRPLTFHDIAICKVASGGQFDLASWTCVGGVSDVLSVDRGVIHSTLPGEPIY
jgi:cyanophycinase